MPPIHLCILDDDPVVATVIDAAAKAMGATTDVWHEPLRFLESGRVHAQTHIVLDMRMPGMDGVTVLAELARQQCQACIILTSGNPYEAEEALQRWQTDLNIIGVLPKPFRAAQLRGLLGRAQ